MSNPRRSLHLVGDVDHRARHDAAFARYRALPLAAQRANTTAMQWALIEGVLPCGNGGGVAACAAVEAFRWCEVKAKTGGFKLGCDYSDEIDGARSRSSDYFDMGIPVRWNDVLSRAFWNDEEYTGELQAPTPLLDTDAIRVVRAYLALDGGKVRIKGGELVTFRSALDGTQELLILAGPPGRGKSFAAAFALLSHGFGKWVRAADLTRVGASPRPEEIGETPGLVVVDDVGLEHDGSSGWAAGVIDRLVAQRHDDKERLILTTNLNRRDFADRYGQRILDRVAEAGAFVELPGPSLRRRAR